MPEIACVGGVDRLMDYLEGVLSADARRAINAHVAGCPRCVAFVDSYRQTPRIFRDATAAPIDEGVQRSLRDFLRARRNRG